MGPQVTSYWLLCLWWTAFFEHLHSCLSFSVKIDWKYRLLSWTEAEEACVTNLQFPWFLVAAKESIQVYILLPSQKQHLQNDG